MENQYGLLLNQDAKLHRKWFEEMVSLLGIMVKYRAPVMDYTLHGEMKPLRYEAELVESAALIHMPYDLKGLQIGGLVEVPSGYDNTQSRLFRITKMSGIMVYPASITCEIVPEYIDTAQRSEIEDFHMSNFNLLNGVD